ncbi:cupin domain-containing protein [Brachybacterium vulturis]|uniref:cupin domain-containing protein n=1 Tax=Brachybacterium vulturis TaxID=2017484 RepID=UPI003735C84C
MELRTTKDFAIRRSPGENTPTVTVIAGGEENGPDVGVARVRVPVGASMPAHRHNGSDVIITAVAGQVSISDGSASIDVPAGSSAVIGKDEKVSLRNSSDESAELIVSAGPADFLAGIRQWPDPTHS